MQKKGDSATVNGTIVSMSVVASNLSQFYYYIMHKRFVSYILPPFPLRDSGDVVLASMLYLRRAFNCNEYIYALPFRCAYAQYAQKPACRTNEPRQNGISVVQVFVTCIEDELTKHINSN